MSIFVSCTGCLKQLKLPDNAAGRKVRCPLCQTTFVAQTPAEEIEVLELVEPAPARPAPQAVSRPSAVLAAPPPVPPVRSAELPAESPDDALPDDDRGSPPGGNRAGWRKVHAGLGLILLAIILSIAGAVLLAGASFLIAMVGAAGAQQMNQGFNPGRAFNPNQFNNPNAMAAANGNGLGVFLGAAMLIPLLTIALGLAVFVTFLVGHAFCMLVPAAKGNGGFARGLSVAAFCSFSSVTGAWVGTILHYFYLWSVCHALKKPIMARNVSNFMWAHVIMVAGLFLGFLLGIVIGTMGLTVVAGFWIVGLMLLTGLGSLALFIWYIVLLVQIRAAIEPVI